MVSKSKSGINMKKEAARKIALEILNEIEPCMELDETALTEVTAGLSKTRHLFVLMKKNKHGEVKGQIRKKHTVLFDKNCWKTDL